MRRGMIVNGGGFVWAALLALSAPVVVVAQARENLSMTEREAAAALSDNRLTPERDEAIRLALELGPRAGPQLRTAVIEAAWAELRGETNRPEGSEAIFDYMHAVAQLREPRAIPFLVEVLRNGPAAANALADLGAAAFPAVLEAAANPSESDRSRVWNGLTALRFMLEDGSLGTREVAQVREVARDRLSGTQDNGVVLGAMRLALVLGDPELRRIVERLATDRAAAEALVSPYLSDGTRTRYHESNLDGVQERACVLLAGQADDIGPLRRPFPRG